MVIEIDFLDRKASLEELRQSMTYESLLEGRPTTELNQRIIVGVIQDNEKSKYGVQPLLVPSVEKHIEAPEGWDYDFGIPASLPRILCMGRLESRAPSSIGTGDWSGLIVVWFQHEFAYPIDPDVLLYFSRKSWDGCAGSYDL